MSDEELVADADREYPGEWEYECMDCGETRECDSQADALDLSGNHFEHGRCEFDFRIISPDGRVTHP